MLLREWTDPLLTCSDSEWIVHRSHPWPFSLLQGILSVGHTVKEERELIIIKGHLNSSL